MHAVVDHPRGWMPFEYLVESFQFFRQPDVIRIQQRDHFAARMLETEIERRGLPAIRLSQVADRISKFPQSFLRVIGRTIIHHQNLPLFSWEILRQGARNRFFDVLTVVVGIDQNAEEGGSHSSSRSEER